MGKKRLIGIFLSLAVLLLAAAAAAAGVMMERYPQRVILPEELYGAEQENLKDFALDEQGSLTARSSDPWILFDLGEEISLRQITVYVSGVETEGQMTQFFIAPSYQYVTTTLKNGAVTATIPSAVDRHHISGVRFDMTSQVESSFRIERVVLNSRAGLAAVCAKLALCGLAMLAMLSAEACLWVSLMRRERAEAAGSRRWMFRRLIPVAAQTALKLALAAVLLGNLVGDDGGDHSRLLCWLLVLGMECTSLGAVAIRYLGRQKNQLWVMGLLPFWSVTMFSAMELLNLANFDFQSPKFLALNLLCCCVAAGVLMLLLRWGALALTLSTALFTVWGLANHYFGSLRGNPLEWSDLAQAGTAANVVTNYNFRPEAVTVTAVLAGAALSVGFFAALGRCCWTWEWKREGCGLAAVAAAALAFGLFLPSYDINQAWDISSVTGRYGYLLSFASYAKAGAGDGKPEGYSAELADAVLADAVLADAQTVNAVLTDEEQTAAELEYQEDDGGEAAGPNVIAIMDEAFADLPEIYGFETDGDVLPNLHAMQEDTITGSLLVSVFGGGTSNTEYEFLTGNSLYALPLGSCPYVQYMSASQQSIAWHMQHLGYSTAAYHPFDPSGYRRTANYPLLGLDPFYSISADLPAQDTLRGFLSDSSDFQNIITLYEQRDEDQPFFLFNVTMQNHGGYSADAPAVEVTVQPESEELCTPQLLEYLSLIHETDAAFGALVDYFSQVEEDTIILMFGDHQPGLGDETMSALEGQYTGDSALVETGNLKYLSSFVLWANFDIEEASDVLTSPNYLRAMLLEQAGVPLTAYEQFLLQLQQEYPALNCYSCLDSQGQWHTRGEADSQALEEYACLVYNNVFDKKHMTEEYYS